MEQTDNAIRTIIIDGWHINEDTGEILGPVVPEGFHIHDDDTFEWFMGKRFELSSQIDELERKKKTVIDNLDKMIKERNRKIESLDFRFKFEVESYTKQLLEGKKKKSIRCMYGVTGFREIKKNYEIADKEKAIKWAEAYHPDAISKDFRKDAVSVENVSDAPPGVFNIIPGYDKFYIKTEITH